jgi:hypothetical protein
MTTKIKSSNLSIPISDATITSLVATSADINGGTIDGTTIGTTAAAAIAGTTGSFTEVNIRDLLKLPQLSQDTIDGLVGQVGIGSLVQNVSTRSVNLYDGVSWVALVVSGTFSPATELFGLGEPGAWYDPSDLTTMFQDRAGTTPVTAAGQSVGLRLDKSKGLVLGPELVTNGGFEIDTSGWEVTGSATFIASSGVAAFTRTAFGETARTSFATVSGRSYEVMFTVVSGGTAPARVNFNSTGANNAVPPFAELNVAGTYRAILTANATTMFLTLGTASNGTVVYDNISVREIPGNHAVANSDAARGIYGIEPVGGRRNLLQSTEDFSNAYWTAAAVNLTSIAAGRITPNTTSSQHRYDRTTTIAAAAHTFSLEVKADGYNFIWIRLGAITAVFNATTGSPTGVSAGATASFVNADGGYIRITLSGTAAGNDTLRIGALPSTSTADFAGDGTSGILIRRAQLELGSTATPYQRVTTQYDVTEAGKQTLHYVQYDGADDGYVTPTITPGIDKVQVFAGVRKLSDALRGMILESSAVFTNNGTIGLEAPIADGDPRYRWSSRGTISTSTISASFAAPVTSVLTGIGDIAGDVSRLRINGSQVAETLTDQGTSNYLAYPLYIGRRGGTSLSFNGRDYGLIVRFGPNLDAAIIEKTERWMNQRTGAY